MVLSEFPRIDAVRSHTQVVGATRFRIDHCAGCVIAIECSELKGLFIFKCAETFNICFVAAAVCGISNRR